MIRLVLLIAALGHATVPSIAQQRRPDPKIGETLVLSATARKDMKVQIEAAGLNCPSLAKITYVEETVAGRIMRIECYSSDRKSQWEIRATVSPADPVIPKFEPW